MEAAIAKMQIQIQLQTPGFDHSAITRCMEAATAKIQIQIQTPRF